MTSPIILVTGSSRGIGLGIVQLLAQQRGDLTILVAARTLHSAQNTVAHLRDTGLRADFHAVELDVTSDESVQNLVLEVERGFARLDVLINNAGIAAPPTSDSHTLRATYNTIFNTNITSIALLCSSLIPLLRKSALPRIINVSSGRASVYRLVSGDLPPTVSVPYSVSKVGLNVLTLEMGKVNPAIAFYVANPGHCRTDLNGNRGPKPPIQGAEVVVKLALGEGGRYKSGFWEYEDGAMREVPW